MRTMKKKNMKIKLSARLSRLQNEEEFSHVQNKMPVGLQPLPFYSRHVERQM